MALLTAVVAVDACVIRVGMIVMVIVVVVVVVLGMVVVVVVVAAVVVMMAVSGRGCGRGAAGRVWS